MYVLVQASLAAKVTRVNFIVRGLTEPTLLLCCGVLAALIGRTVAHLAVAQVLTSAGDAILAVVFVGRVFGRGELTRAVRAPRLPGFTAASLPIGAAELTNAILQRADIVLLTGFVGPSATRCTSRRSTCRASLATRGPHSTHRRANLLGGAAPRAARRLRANLH